MTRALSDAAGLKVDGEFVSPVEFTVDGLDVIISLDPRTGQDSIVVHSGLGKIPAQRELEVYRNDSHTVGDGLWNRCLALFRCLGHTCSFIGNKDPGGYRGEKFEKGEGKELLNGFKEAVNSMKHIDKDTKEALISQVKKHGATEMNRALEMLLNVDGGAAAPEEKQAFQDLKTRLDDWMGGMGPDLGIERKGNEIHLTLPTPQGGPQDN